MNNDVTSFVPYASIQCVHIGTHIILYIKLRNMLFVAQYPSSALYEYMDTSPWTNLTDGSFQSPKGTVSRTSLLNLPGANICGHLSSHDSTLSVLDYKYKDFSLLPAVL